MTRKKKKPVGMSAKVLERREKRFDRVYLRWANFLTALTVVVIVGPMAWYSWLSYKAVHAPDWANFVVRSGEQSFVPAYSGAAVPNSLTINGEHWDVVMVDDWTDDKARTRAAETMCEKHLIAYLEDEDANRLKRSLTHEVFHAGACLHGDTAKWWNSSSDEKHEGIYHLGDFTSNFIHDNPNFANWLVQ